MYEYLGAHPLVVPCRAKELHFADRPHNVARGREVVPIVVPASSHPRPGRAGRRGQPGTLR